MLHIDSADIRIEAIEYCTESNSENSPREAAREGCFAGNTDFFNGDESANFETERNKDNPKALPGSLTCSGNGCCWNEQI